MKEKVITREDAIEIASLYNKVDQVDFFIVFLGMPPREALIKAEINIEEYEQYSKEFFPIIEATEEQRDIPEI